jgi:hypothetical protein
MGGGMPSHPALAAICARERRSLQLQSRLIAQTFLASVQVDAHTDTGISVYL